MEEWYGIANGLISFRKNTWPNSRTCSGKSYDWVWILCLTWGGVRRKFLLLVKMVDNLVGHARKHG